MSTYHIASTCLRSAFKHRSNPVSCGHYESHVIEKPRVGEVGGMGRVLGFACFVKCEGETDLWDCEQKRSEVPTRRPADAPHQAAFRPSHDAAEWAELFVRPLTSSVKQSSQALPKPSWFFLKLLCRDTALSLVPPSCCGQCSIRGALERRWKLGHGSDNRTNRLYRNIDKRRFNVGTGSCSYRG